MSRRTLSFVAAVLTALTVASSTWAADAVVPKPGVFAGPTSQHSLRASVKVTSVGERRTAGLNIAVQVQCVSENGSAPVLVSLLSNGVVSGVDGNLGNPVAVKRGKFSLKRTIPFGAGGTVKAAVSGKFKTATKLVGTVSLTEGTLPFAPGATCASGKVTFAAKRSGGPPAKR